MEYMRIRGAPGALLAFVRCVVEVSGNISDFDARLMAARQIGFYGIRPFRGGIGQICGVLVWRGIAGVYERRLWALPAIQSIKKSPQINTDKKGFVSGNPR